MNEFFRGLLDTQGFHPHGYCYLWKPELIWLHVVSDALIGLAYVAIGFSLALFVRRGRGELPFSRMFIAFGVFIAACGATHFVEIWTLWTPAYWAAGGVKVVTAAASVLTAVALPPLVPVALRTIADARVSEQRRRELEEAHRRLTELDEAKTRFFASVSHELRTPLTLILGPVDRMLEEGRLPPEELRRVEGVRRSARLLLRHVNDLLDISRLEAGRVEPDFRRVELASLLRLAAAQFETAAAGRGVAVEVEAPERVEAEADPELLERVVYNLLGNALRFTPDGGRVRCVLAGAAEEVALEVHDSGPGVPPEERERIFEPYRQGEGATGGTGLGLAIAAELVSLHGGALRVDDSPLGGAAFRVTLPRRGGAEVPAEEPSRSGAPPVVEVDAPAPAVVEPPPVEGEPGRPLVLLVEDNREMSDFVAEILRGEYRVARAFDGAEGVRRALELEPELILSDLMMPRMGGEALVRAVRAEPALEGVPVVLLSARADDAIRVRLLEEGAEDYLIKPFAAAELRARVRTWVGIRRTREILRRELRSTRRDVEALAGEIAGRKRELETALEAARLAFEEAEAANRAKADFLAVMSHELRTPLNAILGYVDLLESGVGGGLGEPQQGYVARVRRSAAHLLALVEDVLEYARMEAGTERISPEEVELAEVVREAAVLVEPDAERKGLALRLELPDAPVRLRTDRGKVLQVLANLAGNAVKFTASGEVRISLSAGAGLARVRVSDTGPGIPREHHARVFDPFWQGDASRTRAAEGTGLGLSIARRLAELLGGELALESEPGTGAVFELRLPRTGDDDPADPGAEPRP
jgi:signal transduction histidine kinase